jgi:thiamine-phosphate pyrophosphorylase
MTRRGWELYLITDRGLAGGRPIESVVDAAVRGGVTAVQLREKNCCTRGFVELGRALARMLAPLDVPLIVNDRVDVALAIGAAGVHLGQGDMDYGTARRLLGPDAAIGLSIETVEQARAAEPLDVDYLGVGPVFPTATKPDAAPALGLAGLAQVRAVSRHRLVAIGGIGAGNARQAIESGADGVAVVSAICAAGDPGHAAAELWKAIDAALRARREAVKTGNK